MSKRKLDGSIPFDPIICIVGGGLGGLACALALQELGFQVKVFERDSYFADRKQGYGLTLTNNKKGPLSKLGLLDDCNRQDCASNYHWTFNSLGEIIGYFGRDFTRHKIPNDGCKLSGQVERGNLRIPRQDLRRMLLEKLTDGTVLWGHKLITLAEAENGVTLEFESNMYDGVHDENLIAVGNGNGNSKTRVHFTADLVVGADGIHSRVRQLRDSNLTAYGIPESPLTYVGTS